jgi:hypothetical protein
VSIFEGFIKNILNVAVPTFGNDFKFSKNPVNKNIDGGKKLLAEKIY